MPGLKQYTQELAVCELCSCLLILNVMDNLMWVAIISVISSFPLTLGLPWVTNLGINLRTQRTEDQKSVTVTLKLIGLGESRKWF